MSELDLTTSTETTTPPEGASDTTQVADSAPGPSSNRPAWMGQLTPDLKEHDGLTQFNTISDMGKAYLELQGKTENAIVKPGENATDEEKAKYREALGIPQSADGYQIEIGEDVKDLVDNNALTEFKSKAFEHGLSSDAAKELASWWLGKQAAAVAEHNTKLVEARNEAEAALKSEWRGDFDKNVEFAKRAIRQFGGEDFGKYMNETGLGNSPQIAKIFAEIGKAMAEDMFVDGGVGSKGRPTMSDGTPMLSTFANMKKQ